MRANAIAFHDRLGTQRPNPFDVPGARGSVDAGAGFLRHLRRAGADAARRTAHQDRLPRFDTRVLEQHLPRGNGDDRKARRCDVVERGGLERDLVGLDQRVLGIAADELVVRRAVHGIAEREHADADAERAATVPLMSEPRVKGSAWPRPLWPSRTSRSHGPTPAAFTTTSTSPASGTGRGISSSRMVSMPPDS